MKPFNFPNRPVLLDGGMGRELRFRGVDTLKPSWSASALLTTPEIVQQIHSDYISAGADVISTNTYGVIRSDLFKEGLEDRFVQLNQIACELAKKARDLADHPVFIAGSLPPLKGSFRPDLVGEIAELEPLYREQAELLAPHVDLLLCETMSTGAEAKAAVTAACQTGKPVWVAWTLHEDHSGRLRSGETIAEAAAALKDLPISGALVNCCSPESITMAMPALTSTGFDFVGGYANTFQSIPESWTLDGGDETDGIIDLRADLDPMEYRQHAADWLKAGATVVGGCCGTRPAHIAEIHNLIMEL
ncbi:MAG: homocysteine S-methyltransferase family protein [Deltaproteobacteria bacterium]|nr:homocysteine S-methyltransferase family protein [Deltaproteobacteria bacterium]MBT4268931.1 homocysteine S-methyltransferase family protein [Deltaproteobacteria bacterium]MBT4642601.1 homocysteine S-methyltransferase family protein [Deltaproteobacteria bacterium]MBT6499507.1 homocysteine S-methyltransferase family protein [Deltaproteobacteria bacterium]